MAFASQTAALAAIKPRVIAIDREKLLRASLGVESIEHEFGSVLQQIGKDLDFAIEVSPAE